LEAMERNDVRGLSVFCAEQNNVSPTFVVDSPPCSTVRDEVNPVYRDGGKYEDAQTILDLDWLTG
jgi:hypothetical protein